MIAFGILLISLGVVLAQDDGGCTATGMEPYDYAQALCMTPLFYEAQRSGVLPPDQRVTWRGDSALDDGADVGVDLTGGYYDAGDFVKFGFPMAYTVTTLAWSIIAYPDGFEIAGQTEYGRAAIKWGSDYLLRAKTGPTELYGQVGEGALDHAYWGRPEEMTMERPAYKITETSPGTDLAAETAAALAATSLVFQNVSSDYSTECLDAAIELFEFADQYRGIYSQSITDADGYYTSQSYEDELAWGALWLYKATGDEDYMTRAKQFVRDFKDDNWSINLDWEVKAPGVRALLAELDGGEEYVNDFRQYIESVLAYQTTPQGLFYFGEWGPLREAMGVAFLAIRAASLGLSPIRYNTWAQQQLDYVLGSTGRSFIVGFGENPPQYIHHASSSCPDLPAPCDWNNEDSPDPNPQTLFGAMVGGPDENDVYVDDRYDYVHNEVACDYNSLYSGVLAAVIERTSQIDESFF